jgi:hypothetical protein
MLFRAKRAIRRAWFNQNSRSLLKTPPVGSPNANFTLVTQTCHGEVLMNLLAIKSFVNYLGRTPNIVSMSDGSLTPEDQTTLSKHLPHARKVHISEIPKAHVPKGGSWESLMLVCDVAQDSYVVQIDSDTLCQHPLPEVNDCIDSNRAFTLLGDRSFPEIEPMLSACERSKNNPSNLIQAVCERSFDQLPDSPSLKYVRGNAGFIGFPKGSIDRDRIEWFSHQLRTLTKEQWDEWGSEQVTTNLLIANIENSYALQFPKYLSYWAHPDVAYEQSSFVHFIGPCRFANGVYVKSAKRVIAALPNAARAK